MRSLSPVHIRQWPLLFDWLDRYLSLASVCLSPYFPTPCYVRGVSRTAPAVLVSRLNVACLTAPAAAMSTASLPCCGRNELSHSPRLITTIVRSPPSSAVCAPRKSGRSVLILTACKISEIPRKFTANGISQHGTTTSAPSTPSATDCHSAHKKLFPD
jgi:hypothetical protein